MKTYRILFIGNSYTFYNDMPNALFKPFAAAAGINVEVDTVLKGGYKLSQFLDPENEYGARVAAALSGDVCYDYVVLQEQSLLPSINTEAFHTSVRRLVARIRDIGATPVLYATWGRKKGSKALRDNGMTNESMTDRTAEAYSAIGEELSVKVAHVGRAFYEVYTGRSGIELYDPDKTHPSREGSFLAAATVCARIFDIDPTHVPFNAGYEDSVAEVLRSAAKR